MTVQKCCIIDALDLIIANNLLYKAIKINYHLLNSIWNDEFISCRIIIHIINYNYKHYKHLSYIAVFGKNNYKNYFYTIIVDIKI